MNKETAAEVLTVITFEFAEFPLLPTLTLSVGNLLREYGSMQ